MIRKSIHVNRIRAGLPITFAIALGVALAAPASAQDTAPDMRAYLDQTRAMVREGRYQEALERFVWFHEHALEHDPGMEGVRLSFALSDWANLTGHYPPARTAFVAMRDSTHARLLAQPANLQLFKDLRGLNRTLNREAETLQVFEQIAAENPAAAAALWSEALDMAIDAQRLDLIRTHGADLLGHFELARQTYLLGLESEVVRPELRDRWRSVLENILVTQSLRLIQTALALGQYETAKAIQGRALALVPNDRVRTAVPVGSAEYP